MAPNQEKILEPESRRAGEPENEQFQKPKQADAVPAHNPGKREVRQTARLNDAGGHRGEVTNPEPAADSNPHIGGADLTNRSELLVATAAARPRGECGQETTYQQPEQPFDGHRTMDSLNQPKDKSAVVELEARQDFTNSYALQKNEAMLPVPAPGPATVLAEGKAAARASQPQSKSFAESNLLQGTSREESVAGPDMHNPESRVSGDHAVASDVFDA